MEGMAQPVQDRGEQPQPWLADLGEWVCRPACPFLLPLGKGVCVERLGVGAGYLGSWRETALPFSCEESLPYIGGPEVDLGTLVLGAFVQAVV